jgi:hypothetical protein
LCSCWSLWTHHITQAVIYIGVPPVNSYVHSVGLGKYIITGILCYSIIPNSFTTLKILCSLFVFLSPKSLATINLFCCLHNFVLSRMSHSWNHTVYMHIYSYWLLQLYNLHLIFIHDLIVQLFWVLNNIPLYRSTIGF